MYGHFPLQGKRVENLSGIWMLVGSRDMPSHYLDLRRLSRAPSLRGWLVSCEMQVFIKLNYLNYEICLLESTEINPTTLPICETLPLQRLVLTLSHELSLDFFCLLLWNLVS